MRQTASTKYRVKVVPVPWYRQALKTAMNVFMATSQQTTQPIVPWRDQAVIERASDGDLVTVIRNDSSGASDRVSAVRVDVDELSIEAFETEWL